MEEQITLALEFISFQATLCMHFSLILLIRRRESRPSKSATHPKTFGCLVTRTLSFETCKGCFPSSN